MKQPVHCFTITNHFTSTLGLWAGPLYANNRIKQIYTT